MCGKFLYTTEIIRNLKYIIVILRVFFRYWGLTSGSYAWCAITWARALSNFCFSYLSHRSVLFCLGQPQTGIPLPTLPSWLGSQVCTSTPASLLRWGLTNFLPGLALNCGPSNLHFPSSWEYRHWPLCLAL
jgi:hypothetical protein